ncbi:conserved hypothetical protein [Ricinus communis]|uniref:Uncharacterized protein n=1 Tax=Ricinus communis TaxID=3988 RepID=B9RSB1_RICCO|nr:conserved hypothetical protein [Ricinus communis]
MEITDEKGKEKKRRMKGLGWLISRKELVVMEQNEGGSGYNVRKQEGKFIILEKLAFDPSN